MSLLSVVSVTRDGSILWNGRKISENQLTTYLTATAEMVPQPVVQVTFADSVDCDKVARLRRMMADTLDCQFGKCAEGSGKWWRIGDVVFPGVAPQAYDPDAPPRNAD